MTTGATSSRGSSIGPLRSRRGCKTCKTRRVKCGEEKPYCLRCSSTGRRCEYQNPAYGTFSSSSIVSVVQTPPSASPNRSWRERRAFTYYFQHAAPMIGGLDADFWSTILPRVSHSEPAVWDAIISISSLFESYKPATPTHKYQDALGWYSRSVSAVRQRIERGGADVFVSLISCVLFICIEALQGSAPEAFRLYNQGINLILALREHVASGNVPKSRAALLEDTIVPIFSRLSLTGNAQNQISADALLRDMDRAVPQGFESLKAAREAIFILTSETHILQKACEKYHDTTSDFQVPDHLMVEQIALLSRLKEWRSAFDTLTTNLQKNLTPIPPTQHQHQTRITALLTTHHETLCILITTCISRFKTTTDTCIPNFQSIVTQSRIALDASARADGSQPPFTLDIGVAFPLLVTIFRCAEPNIRRAALALMRRAPSVQGVYANHLGAAFCENVIRIEEMIAGDIAASQALSCSQGQTPPLLSPPLTIDRQSPSAYSYASDTESMTMSMRVNNPDRSPSPYPVGMGMPVPLPEEARIKPYAVFRPLDGIPPGLEGHVARWNVSPEQSFMVFSRNVRDSQTGLWKVIDECAPLDFKWT
ncbi:Zn(II)2Cys6 transcription factor [Aspergillus stella-maris]|uniref:Zn(II)2Cys6 transcription factor n=1 Tax=Aspergillus stella-maris TaxID=1810926 RepID=UPI003CCDD3FC